MAADMGAQAAAAARLWLGTPYQHQASCIGAGCDCLGLLRGVWRSLFGAEPCPVPAYSPDWAEADGQEPLLQAAAAHLAPAAPTPAIGDIIILRMRDHGPAKHVAILGQLNPPTLIHAYSGRGVVESPLTPSWARRIAARYRFPDRSI